MSSSPLHLAAASQIEAVASVTRQEVGDVVAAIGPCTIAEIAEHLGRSPNALYHHIRILLTCGVLQRAGVRETDGREAVLYRTPSRQIYLRYDPKNRKNVAAICKVAGSMSRVAQRDFRSAFRPDTAVVSGPYRNLWAARTTGWLSKKELREVNQHLLAIIDLFTQGRPAQGRELHALAWSLAPLDGSVGRTRARKKK